MEIQGKKYEVILLRDLKYEEKGKIPEFILEDVLNKYAKAGYRAVCVWKDVMVMENLKNAKR